MPYTMLTRRIAWRRVLYRFVARRDTQRLEGISELYDRSVDPNEKRNLIDSKTHSAARDMMQFRLLSWYSNTTGVPPMDKDGRDLPPCYPTRSHAVCPDARASWTGRIRRGGVRNYFFMSL